MSVHFLEKRLSKELSILFALLIILVLAVLGYVSLNYKGLGVVENREESVQEEIQVERNLVALGDSITNAAILSSEKTGDNVEYSFSTGTAIESFYKLLTADEESIVPYNLAVSGAESANVLETQVPQVASYNPKYITLVIGGNDLLNGKSVESFTNNLSLIAAQIKREDTKVLIASNPDISNIRNMQIPACRKHLTNALIEAEKQARIEKYNQAIKDVADKNGFILVDLHNVLDSGDISTHDCLHLNESGQTKLAKAFHDALKNN